MGFQSASWGFKIHFGIPEPTALLAQKVSEKLHNNEAIEGIFPRVWFQGVRIICA